MKFFVSCFTSPCNWSASDIGQQIISLYLLGKILLNLAHIVNGALSDADVCLLVRALALSDPYCQSTCLSVCLCVCLFVRNFMLNILET